MSIYSEISKRIGWDKKTVSIPTVERARELYDAVNKEDLNAFETVFNIHRFAASGTNETESMALQIILHAYKLGRDNKNWN